MPLYAGCALLVRHDAMSTTHSAVLSYRVAVSRDEAVGSIIAAAMAQKPGFAVSEVLCMEVPDDVIQTAAGNVEAKGEK